MQITQDSKEQLTKFLLLQASDNQIISFFGYDPCGFDRADVQNIIEQMPAENVNDFIDEFRL